jgi:hypothetical protein
MRRGYVAAAMDEQSEATMKHLLPELAAAVAKVVPSDALLVRLEDRWETFVDGRALRTMTADFAPSEDGSTVGALRAHFGTQIGQAYRHLEFEAAESRDVFERDRTVVRVWRAVTRLPQGYEVDTVRLDAKVAAPEACPLAFSEVYKKLRERIGEGPTLMALREHAMDLDELARIAVVTEREEIGGVDVGKLGDLTGAGLRALADGTRALRQVGAGFELRAKLAAAPRGAAFEMMMIRSGDQATGAS